jgi:hypothetical protein
VTKLSSIQVAPFRKRTCWDLHRETHILAAILINKASYKGTAAVED